MQIGEHYKVKSEHCVDANYNKTKPLMTGTIIYVHPLARYAVLEFECVCGTYRECFWPEQLTEKNRVQRRKRRCTMF